MAIQAQAYSAKSSAVRAAKKTYGAEWETKAAILPALPEQGQGFVIIERKPEAAPSNGHMTLAEALAESGESIDDLKDDVAPAKAKAEPNGDALANKIAMGWKLSSTEKPTKKVWAIASEMPGKSRKEVIEACIAAGIGAGTARTQYQAWFSAMKASGAFNQEGA